MGLQAGEIVLDCEIGAPDDRSVTHVDDLQDAIAGHRPAGARIADQAGRVPRWRLLEAR
jgi:hypothetical protein